MRTLLLPLVAVAALVALAACGSSEQPAAPSASASSAQRGLLPVELPDLSRMDATVQAQARERYALVEQKRGEAGASGKEVGEAYGQLGILLHAAEYTDAAEPAYLNAQSLQPDDLRWPYYLAHLYKTGGQTQKAIDAFERSLEIKPDDQAALVWLGRMYLEQGQPDEARRLFERAAAGTPRPIAAVAGLGQAALAKRDYPRAVSLLEEALTLNPRAASIHSPLAMAYRGLGDTAKAEAHLKQWRNTELRVVDPLSEALRLSVQSGLSYELQGVSALDRRDFAAAAQLFREGVAVTPATTTLGRSLRHKLGTALALSGDVDGALRQFEEVTKFAPEDGLDEPAAKAFYSLGVVMAGAGRSNEAIAHLTQAVKYSPSYLEARLALGDALRRRGRFEPAMKEYAEIVRLSPMATEARFGYAMSLVRLERWVEARDWLDEAVRVQPDRPDLAHALARVLAAAPDARARDGRRAATIAEGLLQIQKTTDVGETMAMALAEIGRFEDAAALQRDIVAAARRAGIDARRVAHLRANLRSYEQRQPCRTPWTDDDPVHAPGPRGSEADV